MDALRTLACHALPVSLRWLMWAQVLGYGSWGWLWSMDAAARIDANVHRIAQVMMNTHRVDGEGRVTWHAQSMSGAKLWVR